MTERAVRIVLETEVGAIIISPNATAAPATSRYVMELVESGVFDGATLYRSTNFGVDGRRPLIQGGPLAPLFTGSATPIPPVEMLDMVESSTVTGLSHVRGTASLARDLFSSGKVVPELFICLGDFPELDEHGRSEPDTLGFPAFGSVSAGLDVVESIAAMETDGASLVERLVGEVLTHPVVITRAVIDVSPMESTTPT